jgi:hypothetical protein
VASRTARSWKGEEKRLLTAAFMMRAIVLWTMGSAETDKTASKQRPLDATVQTSRIYSRKARSGYWIGSGTASGG